MIGENWQTDISDRLAILKVDSYQIGLTDVPTG